jgi:hypothetical protein
MTKQRQNPFWIAMAFIALLATMLPSLVWSCPMTGRIGDAALICNYAARTSSSRSSSMPCCQHPMDGKCCKRTPQPSNNDNGKDVSFALAKMLTAALLTHGICSHGASYLAFIAPSRPASLCAPTGCVLERNESLWLFLPQHIPLNTAQRAPPTSYTP